MNFLKGFSSDYKRGKKQTSLFNANTEKYHFPGPPWALVCWAEDGPARRSPAPPALARGPPAEETKETVPSIEACRRHLPGAEGLRQQLTPIQADTQREELPSALGDLVSSMIKPQSQNPTSF